MVEAWEARKYFQTFSSGQWREVVVRLRASHSQMRFRWGLANIDPNTRDETGRSTSYNWPSKCGSSNTNRWAIDNVIVESLPGGGP